VGTLAEVLFSARARRDLRRIDPRTRARIVSAIEQYAETGVGDVKSVQPLGGLRLRRGDWRVFFRRPEKAIVEVDAILHRREAYRRT
jgi:mRNA-degrading endonuclease RelE of RelBE toxin-antitoxin system